MVKFVHAVRTVEFAEVVVVDDDVGAGVLGCWLRLKGPPGHASEALRPSQSISYPLARLAFVYRLLLQTSLFRW